MNKKDENIGRILSKLQVVSAFGFTIIANILISILIGIWLDRFFNTNNKITIVFIIFGVISGFYNGLRFLLKEIERFEKNEKLRKK